jgi:hypothetical protein
MVAVARYIDALDIFAYRSRDRNLALIPSLQLDRPGDVVDFHDAVGICGVVFVHTHSVSEPWQHECRKRTGENHFS